MVGRDNAVDKPVEQSAGTSQNETPPVEADPKTIAVEQAQPMASPLVEEEKQGEIIGESDQAEKQLESAQPTESDANKGDTESAKPKKAVGEVFQELKSVVIGMDYKMDEVSRFVHLAKDKLVRQENEYVREGKLKVLESFFELHDMLFRRIMAMEAGSLEPDSFCIELMQFAQEILGKHGIDVIIPQPGDLFDMNYMESLSSVPARFWRSPDTVAKVDKCGYAEQISETEEKVLRPARVHVYRK